MAEHPPFVKGKRVERYREWSLTGRGIVRGKWPVPEGHEPDAFVELHYDGSGRLIGIREWLEGESRPVERRLTLHGSGRLLRSDRSGPDPSIQMRNSYAYDGRGMLQQRQEKNVTTGAVRFQTRSKCDGRGNIVENALHDGAGNLKEVATYEYDAQGRCIKETKRRGEKVSGFFTYQYDDAGHEVRRTWHGPDGAKRTSTETAFDEYDRPIEITLRPAGGQSKTLRVSYDPKGKKTGMELVGADGSKRAEVRPTPQGGRWRRGFSQPPPLSDEGRGGRFASEGDAPDVSGERRDILVVLAYDHFKNQRYAEALPIFEQLAEAHPDDVYVLSGAGACALRLQRFEIAIRWYDRVLECEPDHEPSLKGRRAARSALGLD